MAAGRRGQQMMFCLPGNPVAAFVCFRLLVSPVLDRLAAQGGQHRPVAVKYLAGEAGITGLNQLITC